MNFNSDMDISSFKDVNFTFDSSHPQNNIYNPINKIGTNEWLISDYGSTKSIYFPVEIEDLLFVQIESTSGICKYLFGGPCTDICPDIPDNGAEICPKEVRCNAIEIDGISYAEIIYEGYALLPLHYSLNANFGSEDPRNGVKPFLESDGYYRQIINPNDTRYYLSIDCKAGENF